MNFLIRLFILLPTVCLLSGCGDKPSRHELSRALHIEAVSNLNRSTSVGRISSDFISVYNFKVMSSENIGNKVTPKIVGRFTANIRLNEDAFSGDTLLPKNNDIKIPVIYSVSVHSEKNHISIFSGVYEATIDSLDSSGNKVWRIWFKELEGVKNDFRGVPLTALGPVWAGETDISKTSYYHVLKGSTEEQAVYDYFESLEQRAEEARIIEQAAIIERKKQADERAKIERQNKLAAKKEQERVYQNKKNKWIEQESSKWSVNVSSFDVHNKLYESCFKINTFFSGGKPILNFEVPQGIKVDETRVISAKLFDPKFPEKWLSHNVKVVLRYNGKQNYILLNMPMEADMSLSSSATPNENCDANSILNSFDLVGRVDENGKKTTSKNTFGNYK